MRVTKKDNYLDIAKSVSMRSTCMSSRYGAIIVTDDQVVGTGYNGSPRGHGNCNESSSICRRRQENTKSGDGYDCCVAVHAEMNALLHAGRKNCIGGDLYLYGEKIETGKIIEDARPCNICMGLIVNAGIKQVITMNKVIPIKKE